nr:hypothetical protein [uncultured Halomonas sp.]
MLDPISTSLLVSLASSGISKCVGIGWDEASRRIKAGMDQGQLPANNVMERAVLRSALLATHHCLDTRTAQKMYAPPTDVPQGISGNADKAAALMKKAHAWLASKERLLEHDARDENKRNEVIRSLLLDAEETGRTASAGATRGIAGLAGTEDQVAEIDALKQTIVEHVIAQSDWNNRDHARAQLLIACAAGEHWDHAFVGFYSQELKDDPALHSVLHTMQLAALDEKQHERDEKMLNTLLSALGTIGEKQKRLAESDAWALEHMFQDTEDRRPISKEGRFHFLNEYDDLLGRGEAIATIENELFDGSDEDRFRWMAVCGEGGTGKSRLCLDIIDKAPGWGYANAGFVDSTFLSDSTRVPSVSENLEQNTLLVVDYSTGVMEHLPRFLADWVRYSRKNSPRPSVRLILILRNPNDPFFKRLENLSAAEEGRAIARAERRHGGERLVLQELSNSDTEKLMLRRMAHVAEETGQPLNSVSEKGLIECLELFDPFKRPLFALMVADLLQRGELDKIEKENTGEEARFALCGAHLKRQRNEYWAPRLKNEKSCSPEHDLERHENVVRLATTLMGIDIKEYCGVQSRAGDDIRGLLPVRRRPSQPDSLHLAVVRTMIGIDIERTESGEKEPGNRIAPLEPDLIGEYFVLEGQKLAEKDCALEPREIVLLAYTHAPDRTLQFLRMAVQDYPQFMASNGFLLPGLSASNAKGGTDTVISDEDEVVRRSAFLRNVCADVSRRAHPDQRTHVEMKVLRLVADMLRILDDQAINAPVYLVNRAYILRQIASVAGNAINANLPIEEDIKAAELEEGAESRLTASFKLQTSGRTQSHGAKDPRISFSRLERTIVDAADYLARFSCKSAWRGLFADHLADSISTDQQAEVAKALFKAVKSVITSVLWDGRNDDEKGGRHSKSLLNDKDDEDWRTEIKDKLITHLRGGNATHRAIAARLLASLADAVSDLPRDDAGAVVEFAYSQEALAQLTDWQTFSYTLGSLHNIVDSLDDPQRKEGDGTERIVEAQARLVERGTTLLRAKLEEVDIADEHVRGAGSLLANAVTVFVNHFDDEDLAPALQQSWRDVAAVLSPYLERFRIDDRVLRFFSLPYTFDFADEKSDLVGMRFAEVLSCLRPLLEAGHIATHDFRHHYRNRIGPHFACYVLRGTAPEDDIRYFLDEMHRHIGEVFMLEACDALSHFDTFELSAGRVQTLFSWAGADGRAASELDDGGKRATAIYALWSRFLLEDRIAEVREAVESFWNEVVPEPALGDILRRALALRGFALLVSYCGAGVDTEARFETRLGALRGRRDIDYRHKAALPATVHQAWTDHDDAIVEATMALATIDIEAGGEVDRWIAEEGWSMNFSSVKELDQRLAAALLKRMQSSADTHAVLDDFARIRRLSQRNGNIMMPAFDVVLELLPADHPQRETLSIERDTLKNRLEITYPRPMTGAHAPITYDADAGALSVDEQTRLMERSATPVSWHLPAPFSWTWEELSGEDFIAVVKRALAALPQEQSLARFDLLDAVRARRVPLYFYEGHEIVEIMIDDGKVKRSLSMVFGPEAALWLTGISPPIHELNKTVPIDLVSGTYIDLYLRFFCAYVHGDEGPFSVVTNYQDLESRLPDDRELTVEEKRLVAEKFGEIETKNHSDAVGEQTDSGIAEDDEGRFRQTALVSYAGDLFVAKFAILSNGMVEMLDDDQVFAEPKLRVERIVHGWRLGVESEEAAR